MSFGLVNAVGTTSRRDSSTLTKVSNLVCGKLATFIYPLDLEHVFSQPGSTERPGPIVEIKLVSMFVNSRRWVLTCCHFLFRVIRNHGRGWATTKLRLKFSICSLSTAVASLNTMASTHLTASSWVLLVHLDNHIGNLSTTFESDIIVMTMFSTFKMVAIAVPPFMVM